MNGYKDSQVMNGTFGEVWMDSDYLAEITSAKAQVTAKTEAVSQCRRLTDGQKMNGLECKGELKLNKVTSRFGNLMSDSLRKGILPEVTLIIKLDDPAAIGAERVKLTGVQFTELTLMDWELKKNGEETVPFTFIDWEYLDKVTA